MSYIAFSAGLLLLGACLTQQEHVTAAGQHSVLQQPLLWRKQHSEWIWSLEYLVSTLQRHVTWHLSTQSLAPACQGQYTSAAQADQTKNICFAMLG